MIQQTALAALAGVAAVVARPLQSEILGRQYVDETYAYTGPDVPVGDWVDGTVNGNGKGFPRLVEQPAVQPGWDNPSNNINVIQLSFAPGGVNVHFQTPFGIGGEPCVNWGTDRKNLSTNVKGSTMTYARTPSCSQVTHITQCSEFFHSVDITGLQADTEYYYQIPGGNGTTPSDIMSFRTAKSAGSDGSFSVAVVHDMGYTNAQGTRAHLARAADMGEVQFAIHGGDISYADDWYEGIIACELTGPDAWPLCYNGTYSTMPENLTTAEYLNAPLPAGEESNQGGPQGGDISVIYESNWDLWQQWMSTAITSKIPYMVSPGNHEAACAEFDGPNNELTAYLNNNQANSSAASAELTYYTCPPTQRNFTAYNHRWSTPSKWSQGVQNHWYSFDYGLAHFISFTAETDYYNSPEKSFAYDTTGSETAPRENETYITNSGPFGYINGSYKVNENYEQWQWLKADLAAVNRTKTPWVFAYAHRPMYSTEVSSYQKNMRNAWEQMFLDYKVDAYMAGHIHWYERLWPLAPNSTIVNASIVNDHAYYSGTGQSLIHLTNGQAGNIESHSFTTSDEPILNVTAYLDQQHYGFSKLTVVNSTAAKWQFIRGVDGQVGDELWMMKKR